MKILPFRGIRYSPKAGDFSKLVTPPYDVIAPELQKELYARSPYNFIRVDLPMEEGSDRYKVAKKTFESWLDERILCKDERPAIYLHHHHFRLEDGRTVLRKGFFAARRLEDFSEGGIKPHEKTLEGPKTDRLLLTRAVETNLSPVFSLYSDPEKRVESLFENTKQKSPDISFDFDGQHHELWVLSDPHIFSAVDAALDQHPLFIADGHHRYETALNYRNECRKRYPSGNGNEAFNNILMYFSNMDDEGMVILPIHRALFNLTLSVEDLVQKLQGTFQIERMDEIDHVILDKLRYNLLSKHAFLIITPDEKKSFLISIDHASWIKTQAARGIDPSLLDLDVSVLHRLIFEEILGITEAAQANQENIIYWKDTSRAIQETRSGNCQITFLLNPTQITSMKNVALAGQKMPQKSTFFYPKILSGVVLYSLKD